MINIFYLFIILLFLNFNSYSQERKVSWKRDKEAEKSVNLFHSNHVYNISTTEMFQKGDLHFVIAHRFIPPISEGTSELYGLDGPANILFSLGYALSNDIYLNLSRSNVADTYTLNGKWQFYQFNNKVVPIHFALEGGAAWNTETTNRDAGNNKNFQYYGQILLNTLIEKKLGIGIVPSYLYNSYIYCKDPKYSFTLGSYIQYYISSTVNVGLEWNKTVTGFKNKYDSFTFGIELETGGHFFKIVFSNNAYLSPTHYLAGSDLPINFDSMRLGFNITRLF